MIENNDITPNNDVDDLDEMFHNADDEITCKCKSQKFLQMMKDYESKVACCSHIVTNEGLQRFV
jgi:uncharacterized protein YacL (UPF0231 family)